MQHTRTPQFIYERLKPRLLLWEQLLWRAAFYAEILGLASLIFTGEWISRLNGGIGLVSLPALRSLHALSGMLLATGVGYRFGVLATKGLRRVLVRRKLRMGDLLDLLTPLKKGRGWLFLGYWVALGVMVLSGLERYFQVRYGQGVEILLQGPVWYALHKLAPSYLYTFILLIAFNWGKMTYARLREYLYAP